MTGWWLGNPSEKYEFVNRDDDSNPIYGKIKFNQSPPTRYTHRVALKQELPSPEFTGSTETSSTGSTASMVLESQKTAASRASANQYT